MSRFRNRESGPRRTAPQVPDGISELGLMTRQEAAAYLRIAPESLSNLHYHKAGPAYYKRGKYVYYFEEDLLEWALSDRREGENKETKETVDDDRPFT